MQNWERDYYALPEIHRPDEWLHALFNNEIDIYQRGFTCGMFGSSDIKTGGGKSISTAAICQEYWPDFDVFKHIVFDPAQGLNLMSEFERKRIKGGMMIFEEAQNYSSNRTWQDLNNRTILHAIATFRNLQCGCFFVTPMRKMIDRDVQKLMRFHASSSLNNNGGLEGHVKFSEVYTYNEDKDLGNRDPVFYCPEDDTIYTMSQARVYASKQLIRDVKQHIDEYKSEYREDLATKIEAYNAAQKNFLKKSSSTVNPREKAEEMLKDPFIINELSTTGKLKSKTVGAFYSQASAKDKDAIHYWAERQWNQLKMVKK